MEAHRFEQAGAHYEVAFERAPEGWLARIRREGSETVHVVGFPDGPGFDVGDVRGSLVAGCEAAVSNLSWAAPTRHCLGTSGTALGSPCHRFRVSGQDDIMTEVTYRIVEHDGGYAYKVGDVFSETFPSHDEALQAAQAAAAEQQVPGSTQPIRYQDGKGDWHDETAQGDDRPTAKVVD